MVLWDIQAPFENTQLQYCTLSGASLSGSVVKGNLSFKQRKATTRRHINDFIELEGKPAIQPLWAPHASKSGKEGVTVLAGVLHPDYQGEAPLVHNGGKKR